MHIIAISFYQTLEILNYIFEHKCIKDEMEYVN